MHNSCRLPTEASHTRSRRIQHQFRNEVHGGAAARNIGIRRIPRQPEQLRKAVMVPLTDCNRSAKSTIDAGRKQKLTKPPLPNDSQPAAHHQPHQRIEGELHRPRRPVDGDTLPVVHVVVVHDEREGRQRVWVVPVQHAPVEPAGLAREAGRVEDRVGAVGMRAERGQVRVVAEGLGRVRGGSEEGAEVVVEGRARRAAADGGSRTRLGRRR
jgi:hypothetical protein